MQSKMENFWNIKQDPHPVLTWVSRPEYVDDCQLLKDFLMYKYATDITKSPITLCDFCTEYLDYLTIRHSHIEENAPVKQFDDSCSKLMRLAWNHKVRGKKIRHLGLLSLLHNKFFDNSSFDLESAALGLLYKKDDGREVYEFRPAFMEDYLLALQHLNSLAHDVSMAYIPKHLGSSLKESMKRFSKTSDAWLMTFGLINQDKRTKSHLTRLVTDILKQCRRYGKLSNFEIGHLCVEAIYESQSEDATLRHTLLDTFTLNQSLYYSKHTLSKEKIDYTLSALSYLMFTSQTMYGLHLPHCEIDEKNIKMLANRGVKITGNSIEVLNLQGNQIGPYGLRSIQRVLATATKLSNLDLSECYLSDEGVQTLTNFFECMPLQNLNLAQNWITSIGIKAMVAKFKFCYHLEALNLSSNLLTDNAATILANGLPMVNSLKVIDLSNNQIGPDGASQVALQLPCMEKIEKISTQEDRFEEFELSQISEKANKQIWQLTSNEFDTEPRKTLETGILLFKRRCDMEPAIPIESPEEESVKSMREKFPYPRKLHSFPKMASSSTTLVFRSPIVGRRHKQKTPLLLNQSLPILV